MCMEIYCIKMRLYCLLYPTLNGIWIKGLVVLGRVAKKPPEGSFSPILVRFGVN